MDKKPYVIALICDDYVRSMHLSSKLELLEAPCEVWAYHSFQEATAKITNRFDVVVCDAVIPDENPQQLIAVCKEWEIPFAAMAAYESQLKRWKKAGAIATLSSFHVKGNGKEADEVVRTFIATLPEITAKLPRKYGS